MTAYYNENDPYATQWLRNLIAANLIAPGEVDDRSIKDVRPDDLRGFDQCHFFAGIGGWSRALRLAGWPDDKAVWTGSCPCQPFSLAGAQQGFDDPRHLWPDWRRLISECRPANVYGEQVASAADWLRLVRSDLEEMDYAMGAMPLQAASAGADHLRDRFYFVAHANDTRSQGRGLLPERTDQRFAGAHGVADADSMRREINQDAGGCENGGTPRQVARLGGACDGHMGITDSAGRQQGQSPAEAARYRGAVESTGSGRLGDARSSTSERNAGSIPGTQAPRDRARELYGSESDGSAIAGAPAFEWVIGADGKARRVKPGIRLLAHGVPARVGKLRAFGNAIYPPIAAAFIKATI